MDPICCAGCHTPIKTRDYIVVDLSIRPTINNQMHDLKGLYFCTLCHEKILQSIILNMRRGIYVSNG
jgi:hypothetical protein